MTENPIIFESLERGTVRRAIPSNHYDLPDRPEGEFWLMAQGMVDYVLGVMPMKHEKYGTMMVVGSEEGAIYVTKEQAMRFFDLREPLTVDLNPLGDKT